jgi:hypothetical protein
MMGQTKRFLWMPSSPEIGSEFALAKGFPWMEWSSKVRAL